MRKSNRSSAATFRPAVGLISSERFPLDTNVPSELIRLAPQPGRYRLAFRAAAAFAFCKLGYPR